MITEAPKRRRSDRGQTPALTALDQGLVAISALVAALAVARVVPAAEFGAFALVLLLRVLLVDLARAIAGQPAQMLSADGADGSNDEAASSFAILVGSALVIPAAVVAARGGLAADYALVLAVSAPAVMAHDTLRHLMFAQRDVRGAVVLDAIVLALQVTIGGIVLLSEARPWAHFAAWAIGTAAATVFGLWRLDARPSLEAARAWPRRTRHIWPGLLVDASLVQTQRQLSSWLMLGYGSLGAVAGYRGSQTTFRPLGVATSGVRVATLPYLSSLSADENSRPRARKRAQLASLFLGSTAVAVTLVIAVLPDSIGSAILGDTWSAMEPFIVPVGIVQIAQSAAVGAQLLLMAQAQTRKLARIRLAALSLHIGAMAIGGASNGAIGAAYGLAITNAAVLPIWWWSITSGGTPSTQAAAEERRIT